MSGLTRDSKRKVAEIDNDSCNSGSQAKRLRQENRVADVPNLAVGGIVDDSFSTSADTPLTTAEDKSSALGGHDYGSTTIDVDFATLAMGDDASARKTLQLAGLAPPLWAMNRGGLCQTAPYFRAVQGGNHTAGAATHGLLFDAGGSPRDHLDATVIIAPVGGGKQLDKPTNTMMRLTDQDEFSRNYRFLLKSKKGGIAIGVVIGDRYPKITLPYPFCVIGQYQVTDLFMERFPNEKGNRVSEWKVRLERIDSSRKPWFAGFVASRDISHTLAPGQFACASRQCNRCETPSKHIYEQGWTCLNHKCAEFFYFTANVDGQSEQHILSSEQVQYNKDFLCERTDPTSTIKIEHMKALTPELPTLADEISFGTEEKFKRGIACPKCHCGSRRIHWDRWECEADDCDYTYSLDTRLYPLSEVTKESLALRRANKLVVEKLVSTWSTEIAGYEAQVFNLPGDTPNAICGTVFVLRATPEICAKTGGPNDMFVAMQQEGKNMKLVRRPVRNSGTRIEALTSHFCSNWGAPYKFGVILKSTSFAEAPKPILDGIAQLSWAQRVAIEATAKKFASPDLKDIYSKESMSLKSEAFNEMLLLGYFESCQIDYHDDGEKELGPTVATLSLGSPSLMSFRPKKKNSIGTSKNTQKGDKDRVIELPLYHGDIVIMHGTEIHKLYDHKVLPQGKLRFGMTSRYIRPELMKTPEERDKAIAMGTIPPGIEHKAYMGLDHGVNTGEDTNEELDDSEHAISQEMSGESSPHPGVSVDGVAIAEEVNDDSHGPERRINQEVIAEQSLQAVIPNKSVSKTTVDEEQPGIPTPESLNHGMDTADASPSLDF